MSERLTRSRHDLASRFDELLAEIRRLTGFERFLARPTADEVMERVDSSVTARLDQPAPAPARTLSGRVIRTTPVAEQKSDC